MPNRYYTKLSQSKITAGKGPTPGLTGIRPVPAAESTAKWNTHGGVSKNLNKAAGFTKVKHSVKTTI